MPLQKIPWVTERPPVTKLLTRLAICFICISIRLSIFVPPPLGFLIGDFFLIVSFLDHWLFLSLEIIS